jgi:HAD superfamily hydrolase (TIGR01509 family)
VVTLRGQKLCLCGQRGANCVLRGALFPRITSKSRYSGHVTCFLSSSETHDVHDTRDSVDVREEEFVRVASKVVSERESAVSNSSYVSSTVTDRGVASGSPVQESTSHTKPIPRNVENPADDPRLENPLKRMERMGTGWMGVIFELEGVCVEYEKKDIVAQAWRETAKLEHKEPPKKWQLDRALGMKNEQSIQEVFCWTRIPQEAKRIGEVKEEILSDLLADSAPVAPQSALRLLKSLESLDTPRALVSSAPEKRVRKILELSGMDGLFDVIVSGEDVYRGKPDPEGYLYAAQQLDRPPFRCVLVGNNNSSIEAAHEVGMQCVAVAGSSPLYEVSAADLAVKSLDDVSFINLKKLFGTEMSNVQFDLEEENM